MRKLSNYSPWVTVLTFILLIICCNIPWAYYPDLGKSFTGLITEKNVYGKPGKFILAIGAMNVICGFIPKLFFKRLNIFISAFNLAYAIKTFIIFAACYHGICPEKKAGLYLILVLTSMMMILSLFPKGNFKSKT